MPETLPIPGPYKCDPVNPKDWSDGMSVGLKLAKLWNSYAPRGKGAVPRLIGRSMPGSLRRRYLTTKHGAKLAFSPSSLEVYAHMLNTGATWNEPVLDTCREYLKDDGVFYDLGANIGYLSIEMSRLFQGNLPVIAFEPQPELVETIAVSAQLNGFDRLQVFDCMLGAEPGESELFVGSHTIHASAVAREEGSASIKRQIESIDRLVGSGTIPPPTVIKMDIEGAELLALSGAKQTLAEHRPVLVFESDENMERFGYQRQELLDLIASCGAYDFFFLNVEGRQLTPITEQNVGRVDGEYTDVLARPA